MVEGRPYVPITQAAPVLIFFEHFQAIYIVILVKNNFLEQ